MHPPFRLLLSFRQRKLRSFHERFSDIQAPAMKPSDPKSNPNFARLAFLTRALAAGGASLAAGLRLDAADLQDPGVDYLKQIEENERQSRSKDAKATIGIGDKLKITKVETFLVKPRWLFLKIH